jgi:Glycosyltransferase family 87
VNGQHREPMRNQRPRMSGESKIAKRWLCRLALGSSVLYFLGAGVLGLWTPRENGIDLSVCYVAGATARRGTSPYDYTELTHTRHDLEAVVAVKPSYPFAYPPSVIPACVLFSLLPWDGAQALWKLLNIGFLVGSVLFLFRLFSGLPFTKDNKYLAWSFAFIFSPTVSVLLVGQSSLLVLFTALLTMILCHRAKPWLPGLSLALALTKPHLTFPLVLLLLLRRRYAIVAVALTTVTALGILGLYLGHSTIPAYLQGVRRYASLNNPTNPRLIGIQNLSTAVLGLPASLAGIVSVSCGLILVGLTLLRDKMSGRDRGADVLPLLLLISVLAFGAHSYDLVLLIPLCIWSIGTASTERRFLLIVGLCCFLIVPLGAVQLMYHAVLSNFISLPVFHIVIEPFRSWILLLLFALVTFLTYGRPVQPCRDACN